MRNINSEDKRKLRIYLCERARGKCEYCNASIGMKGTVDHGIPQAKGGSNERSNLRWSCRCCSWAKGDLMPAQWEEFIPVMKRQARMREDDRMTLLAVVMRKARENWSAA